MSVEAFINTLLLGTTQGALYALIALGYTLVYGIIELINFAHGDLFMLGTFAALTTLEVSSLNKGAPLPLWLGIILALIVAMVFCSLFNVVIERLAYRRLRNAPRLAPLISAIGVSFILQNIGLWWRGASPQSFHTVLGQHNMAADIFGPSLGLTFNYEQLLVLVVTIPLLILLNYVVYRTKIGKAMRATAQDR